MVRIPLLVATLLVAAAAPAAERSRAPEGASLYFITPSDGETVTSPVTVRFGA